VDPAVLNTWMNAVEHIAAAASPTSKPVDQVNKPAAAPTFTTATWVFIMLELFVIHTLVNLRPEMPAVADAVVLAFAVFFAVALVIGTMSLKTQNLCPNNSVISTSRNITPIATPRTSMPGTPLLRSTPGSPRKEGSALASALKQPLVMSELIKAAMEDAAAKADAPAAVRPEPITVYPNMVRRWTVVCLEIVALLAILHFRPELPVEADVVLFIDYLAVVSILVVTTVVTSAPVVYFDVPETVDDSAVVYDNTPPLPVDMAPRWGLVGLASLGLVGMLTMRPDMPKYAELTLFGVYVSVVAVLVYVTIVSAARVEVVFPVRALKKGQKAAARISHAEAVAAGVIPAPSVQPSTPSWGAVVSLIACMLGVLSHRPALPFWADAALFVVYFAVVWALIVATIMGIHSATPAVPVYAPAPKAKSE